MRAAPDSGFARPAGLSEPLLETPPAGDPLDPVRVRGAPAAGQLLETALFRAELAVLFPQRNPFRRTPRFRAVLRRTPLDRAPPRPLGRTGHPGRAPHAA